ncbi:MAG: hypothetical protein CL912_08470 [Deltaproteobacteria bacterium]|nr:hypothetical protein [Deltaproteobacteria bacterium]
MVCKCEWSGRTAPQLTRARLENYKCLDLFYLLDFNNQEETKKSYTADGWFRTGDKGTIDTNGRLCLTGREKDLVIVNGQVDSTLV